MSKVQLRQVQLRQFINESPSLAQVDAIFRCTGRVCRGRLRMAGESVHVVGSGGCAKAICAGLAKQEVVPFAGPMEVYRASPMCGAIPNGQGQYDCPPADECMAEKTPGIAPVALGKVKPSTPIIIDENWTVPTSGSAKGSDDSKKAGK